MVDKNRDIKDKAAKYAKKGQNRKAIAEYQKLLEQEPDDQKTLQRLGELWAREGDKDKSIENFLRAAGGYQRDGFTDRAVAVLKQALAVDPTRAAVTMRLVDAYLEKKLERDAVCLLLRAAGACEKEDKQEEEQAMLERAAEIAPGDIDCRMQLGRMYLRREELDQARAQFLQAALALKRAGRTEEFVTAATKVIELGDPGIELRLELAECHLEREEWDQIPSLLEPALLQKSDDLRALDLTARALEGRGEPGKAASIYKRIARLARRTGDDLAARLAQDRMDEINAERQPAAPPPLPSAPDSDEHDDQGEEEQDADAAPLPAESLDSPDVFDEVTADSGHEGSGPVPSLESEENELEDDEKTIVEGIANVLSSMSPADGQEEIDEELQQDLEEVDFFISQGLLEEAGKMLVDLAADHPGHPAIEERQEGLRHLDDQEE